MWLTVPIQGASESVVPAGSAAEDVGYSQAAYHLMVPGSSWGLHMSVQEFAFNGLTSVSLYLPAAAQVGDQTLTLERLVEHSKF